MKDQFKKLRDKVTSLQDKEALSKEYIIESLGVVVSTTLAGRELGSYVKYPVQGALIGASVGIIIVSGVSANAIGSKLSFKLSPFAKESF